MVVTTNFIAFFSISKFFTYFLNVLRDLQQYFLYQHCAQNKKKDSANQFNEHFLICPFPQNCCVII